MDARYVIRDTSSIFSPALVFYKDIIRHNIRRMIERGSRANGGDDPKGYGEYRRERHGGECQLDGCRHPLGDKGGHRLVGSQRAAELAAPARIDDFSIVL